MTNHLLLQFLVRTFSCCANEQQEEPCILQAVTSLWGFGTHQQPLCDPLGDPVAVRFPCLISLVTYMNMQL